jgi:hypothetical protein
MRQLPPNLLAVLREIAADYKPFCDPDPEEPLGEDFEPPEELFHRKLIESYECAVCTVIGQGPVDHFRPTDLGRAALLVGSIS